MHLSFNYDRLYDFRILSEEIRFMHIQLTLFSWFYQSLYYICSLDLFWVVFKFHIEYFTQGIRILKIATLFNTFQYNKSVYDFSLFIFRLSTVCLLSVCPYTNSVKYIRIDLKLIYAIDIYYGMFFVENEAYSVCFFTRTFKRIPLFYGL